jgi:hypothetical protein
MGDVSRFIALTRFASHLWDIFSRPEHGSSHHRSTHRICGWFVRQPAWNGIAGGRPLLSTDAGAWWAPITACGRLVLVRLDCESCLSVERPQCQGRLKMHPQLAARRRELGRQSPATGVDAGLTVPDQHLRQRPQRPHTAGNAPEQIGRLLGQDQHAGAGSRAARHATTTQPRRSSRCPTGIGADGSHRSNCQTSPGR